MGKTESWRNKKILISQEDYDKLEEDEKEGKYSSEKIVLHRCSHHPSSRTLWTTIGYAYTSTHK